MKGLGKPHIVLALLFLLIPTSGSCLDKKSEYFQSCNKMFRNKPIPFLEKDAFGASESSNESGGGSQLRNPQACFKMSRNEYAVIDDMARASFFYCKLTKKPICRPYDGGASYYPNLEFQREFFGENGKRFVIFASSDLRHGVYGDGYSVFYLKPKDKKGFPFSVTMLAESESFDAGEHTDDNYCGDTESSSEFNQFTVADTASAIEKVIVEGDGTKNIHVRFMIKQQDCDTKKITTGTKLFSFVGGEFIETENTLPPRNVNKLYKPDGVAVDSKGNIYLVEGELSVVLKLDRNKKLSIFAGGQPGFKDGAGAEAMLNRPLDITIDASDNLYISDQGYGALRKIDAHGNVSTICQLDSRYPLTPRANQKPCKLPEGINNINIDKPAADAKGNIYFIDSNAVFKADPDGKIDIISGGIKGYSDGPAATAKFANLTDLFVTPSGEIYVSDAATLRKISSDGMVSTLLSQDNIPGGWRHAPRHIFVATDNTVYFSVGNSIYKIAPDGKIIRYSGNDDEDHDYGSNSGFLDGDIKDAKLSYVSGLVMDKSGNFYVLDSGNEAVREITKDGKVLTIIQRFKRHQEGGSTSQ